MSGRVKRFSALLIALLFLISTLGFTGLVIWQMTQENNNDVSTVDDLATQQDTLQGESLENYEPVKNVSKLTIVELSEGTGAVVKKGDTVTAHYTGALAKNGVIFESSLDSGQPATFALNQVIQGWQDGVPGMKAGGTRRLIIPADLAYGEQATSGIPANSPLVFDIELVDVQ